VKKTIRQTVLSSRPLRAAWTAIRRRELRDEYRSRRDRYAALAAKQGVAYEEGAVIRAVRERIAARGWTVRTRATADVHTFAFLPNIGWHFSMLPDLRELGPLSLYDYVGAGYAVEEFRKRSPAAVARRRQMLDEAFEAMRTAHQQRPLDWAFIYASGIEISPSFVRRITEELGVPVVNMCLDDKNSWTGEEIDGHRSGQIDLAPWFDLSWTSATAACEWYLIEGGRPFYMPEGFSAQVYSPREVSRDLGVSFVGASYGFRASVVEYLEKHDVPVATFGDGWPHAAWVEDAAEVFSRSQVNLGMGGIGYDEDLTNVKGRDFEIPGCGGGVYVTRFNADLAKHFAVGSEILCYANRDEMLEVIRQALARPDDSAAIAQRARRRALNEHRWLHRFERVCRILQVLPGEAL
jgi:hypothetical protein